MESLLPGEIRRNLRTLFFVRFFFIIALFSLFVLLPLITDEPALLFSLKTKVFLILLFSLILINIISFIVSEKLPDSFLTFFCWLQFIVDTVFFVLVAYLSGGITSPYLYFLIITNMYAGILFGEIGSVIVTCMAVSLIAITEIALSYESSHAVLRFFSQSSAVNWSTFFTRLFILFFFLLISGWIASRTAARLRKVSRKLMESDLLAEELKRHFFAVYSNLKIGLVIIKNGSIRYMNGYAGQYYGMLETMVATFIANPLIKKGWQEVRCDRYIFSASLMPYAEQQEILLFSDITDYKKSEEEFQRKEKMAAIGQLTASIAHEIKNPLASLIGASELLCVHGMTPDEETPKLMEIIRREGYRVKKLLDNLFMYTEERRLTFTQVSMKDLLSEVAVMCKPVYPEVFIIDKMDQGMVTGDADRLKEVLWNLLLNSAEAMKGRGYVTVSSFYENRMYVIEVEDEGGGIGAESLSRIFDPFFSTKKRGTGLGLAITYRVMKAHGGKIEVKNGEKGACFTLYFPLDIEEG